MQDFLFYRRIFSFKLKNNLRTESAMRKYPVLRKTITLLVDIAIMSAGYFGAVYFLLTFGAIDAGYLENALGDIPLLVLATAIIILENGLLSVRRMNTSQMVISVILSVIQVSLVMAAASYILQEDVDLRVLALAAALQAAGFIAWNALLQTIENSSRLPKNVLIMGSVEDCGRIAARLTAACFRHYRLKFAPETNLTVGLRKQIAAADLVILTDSVSPAHKDKLLTFANAQGIDAVIVPSFHEILYLDAKIDRLEDIPVLRLRNMLPPKETLLAKRIMDLTISLLALTILLPLMALAALAVKIEDGGPVIYTQTRIGKNGKPFKIYKFRSMVPDAEKRTGPVLAACTDPRVTRVGRFLRAARLDELPQLINVLFGQMSLVGPRPERPIFVKQYARSIPAYRQRHGIKPGITGLAQVYGRYSTDARDKLIYDLIYLQKCSLLTDLDILFRTIKILFLKTSAEGVDRQPHQPAAKNQWAEGSASK